jgi:hypothetical protein
MKEDGLQDLRLRTKAFALRIIKLDAALPKSPEAQVLGKQVLRSGSFEWERIIAKRAVRNLMQTSSVRLKADCKSWKKRFTG